jgi:microcystin-dependent protein
MSNYVKATNFTAKDALPIGDSGKIVKGTEIDVELSAIASAIASKSDSNSPTFTGSPLAPTASAGTNNTQVATTAFVTTAVVTGVASAFPTGGIIMWSGSIASIPSGWALCNGANGTPDLRNRFVVGAGSTYAVDATGGADTVTLTSAQIPSHAHTFSGTTSDQSASHTHTFSATTSTAGAHTHTLSGYGKDGSTFSWPDLEGRGSFRTISNGVNSAGDHAHTVSGTTAGASGGHTHTFSGTTAATGSGQSHENRPPYYALAYIMKL